MGSCFSKKKKNQSPETSYFQQKSPTAESHTLIQPNAINASPPPPPPPIQEETVKQVLQFSETPKPEIEFPDMIEEEHENEEDDEKIEESGLSEIGSLRETVSTATIEEKKEEGNGCDEIEILPKEKRSPARSRRKKPASGDFQGLVERGLRSPARRSDPLPARRPPVREMGLPNRGRAPAENGRFRLDRGEISRRRSRSQENRKEVGRTPSGRNTGRSPIGALVVEAGGGGRRVEAGGGAPPTSEESIEKPLVSLECFIFL
ncbi:hypothetical protein AAC387_Pa07g0957 [Persea americana]